MRSRSFFVLTLTAIIALIASGCALSTGGTPAAGFTARTRFPFTTREAQQPTTVVFNTPTPAPLPSDTPIPATATVPVTATPAPGVNQIFFSPSVTTIRSSGAVVLGKMMQYQFRAEAGQAILLFINSQYSNVFATVTGIQTGQTLLSAPTGAYFWHGIAPVTQDYLLTAASNSATPAGYTLDLTLPQLININQGDPANTIKGNLLAGTATDYLIHASAGQVLDVSLASTKYSVGLTLYGLDDNQPLINYLSGTNTWNGLIPVTEDYIIKLNAVGQTSDFTLNVQIK
ncbi:MAG: hypothetical protein P4L50_27210 [Anaerolineaceae bacterium]|nr:hypothetical protein [Anaerolineaceae bacterium]